MIKVRVIRKRDQAAYWTDLKPKIRPGFAHVGDCYLLEPVWDGRTHYKTIKRFEAEYLVPEPFDK